MPHSAQEASAKANAFDNVVNAFFFNIYQMEVRQACHPAPTEPRRRSTA